MLSPQWHMCSCPHRGTPGAQTPRVTSSFSRKFPESQSAYEVLVREYRGLSIQWRLLSAWLCLANGSAHIPLGLDWEFPEISLCLKLNVGQMQTLGRQSSSVFCLSTHPTSIHPETRGDFLGQTEQFCLLSVHASDIHPFRNQGRFSFDLESKEVGRKLPRIAVLFLHYIFSIYLLTL